MGTPADKFTATATIVPIDTVAGLCASAGPVAARKGLNPSGPWTRIRNPGRGLSVRREAREGPGSGWGSRPAPRVSSGAAAAARLGGDVPTPAPHTALPAGARSAGQTARDRDLRQIREHHGETERCTRGEREKEGTANEGESGFCV